MAVSPEEIQPPVGLCLSGGGFRATAYHLGVLRRLRELGLLSKVDYLSTVSGGSIVGAYWVYWQATQGDTLTSDDEWNKFERSLINVMRRGIRGRIVATAFVTPFLLVSLLVGGVIWLSEALTFGGVAVTLFVALVVAWMCWHFLASEVLQRTYAAMLFGQTKLKDLDPAKLSRRCPVLVMNASGVNHGELVLFPTHEDGPWQPNFYDVFLKLAPTFALKRQITFIPMSPETLVARAVAASSALPGVFGPLTVTDLPRTLPEPTIPTHRSVCGRIVHAIDGGVIDNQGTHLLGSLCRHLIVSDAAAVLKEARLPSLLPLLGGFIFRAQDIIYEQVRDLGYKLLQERQEWYETIRSLLNECKVDGANIDAITPARTRFLESYSYVELLPPTTFKWGPELRLPEPLVEHVAAIRTDLDSFSLKEISALMFHGYTTIDHCLRHYHTGIMPPVAPPLRFTFENDGLFDDWEKRKDEDIERARLHLEASTSRWGLGRQLRRLVGRC